MTLFEYLNQQEDRDHNFRFDRSDGTGLVISYEGYKHMNLLDIRDKLQKDYGLRFDFDKGFEEFDKHCGRTFVYFRDVYSQD